MSSLRQRVTPPEPAGGQVEGCAHGAVHRNRMLACGMPLGDADPLSSQAGSGGRPSALVT